MTITYRDAISALQVVVAGGIDFMDGEAWFDDGEQEYRIPVSSILQILPTEEVRWT